MGDNKCCDENQRQLKILEEPILAKDVEIIVKNAYGPNTKIIDHYVSVFSNEQLGFMGAYRHLVITVQHENSTEKVKDVYFMKFIPREIEEQAAVIQESNAFKKEFMFYKYIVPELLEEVKDQSWLAKCFLAKEDVLILENLTFKNYAIKTKILDFVAMKSALTALAKFHASSVIAEKRLGKTFKQLYPEAFKEGLLVQNGRFYEWFRTSVDVIVDLAKQFGLDHHCVPEICYSIFDMIKPSKKWQNVINNGDLKSYNLMFDDSVPEPKCVIVDFQWIRYVPAMADVSMLFYLNIRKELRDESTKELLKHYHEVFCKILSESDMNIMIPSYSDILQEYEEMHLFGMILSCVCSPINLIDGNKCAELAKDSEGFAKLLFEDHLEPIAEVMKIDSTYCDIITELITELVENSGKLHAMKSENV